ncbi:unnamed protein product [Danaus chrysippus]|uniref:(African queen) hypothetical protein n=1 Tax=Danaus chrysippus TaxID=151541 RepID=A0A8J2QPW9_9NEOP|nr:unnamed protein product [Danaus chrysippus]
MDGCVNVSVADEPALKRCQAFSALQVHVCNLHCIHTHTHRQHAARHGRLCQRERGGRARAQEVPGVQRAADNTLHVMDGCVNVSVADEPALKRCQAFSALQVHVCNLHCIHTHRQHAARHGRLCQRERGGRARAQEVPGVQRAADNTLHVMDGCVNVSVADEPALKRCQAFSALQVHVCNLHCIHTHRQHAARHGRLCQRERGGRARAQEVPGVQRAADNTLHVMDGCVNVSVADEPALKRCQAFSALQVHVCNLHCTHTHRQHAARHGRLCQRERGGRARAQEVPGVQRAADNTLHVMDGCVNVSVADEPALKRCQAFSALQVHVCNLHCIHTHRQHAARHGRLCQRERGGRARAQEVPGVQRAADNTLHVMDGCVNVSVADEPALKRCQAFSALQVHVCNLHCIHTHRQHAARHGRLCQRERGGRARAQEVPGVQRAADNTLHVMDGCVNVSVADEPALKRCQAFSALQVHVCNLHCIHTHTHRQHAARHGRLCQRERGGRARAQEVPGVQRAADNTLHVMDGCVNVSVADEPALKRCQAFSALQVHVCNLHCVYTHTHTDNTLHVMDGCVNVSVADEPALKRCQAFSALQVHVCNLHCIHTHTHRQHAARHGRLCQRERGGRARAQEVPGVQRAADNTLHVMDGCVNVSVADEPALKRCQAFSALQVHVCNLHCIHTHTHTDNTLHVMDGCVNVSVADEPALKRCQAFSALQVHVCNLHCIHTHTHTDNTLHVMDGCVNVSVADEPALKRCQAFSALQVHVCNLHCIHTHRQHAARHGRLCQRERGGRARAQEVPGVQRAADNTLHVMDGCVNVSVADEPALKRCQAFSALQVHVCNLHCIHTHTHTDNTLHVMDGCVNVSVADEPALKRCQAFSALQVHVCNLHCIHTHTHRQHAARHGRLCQRERGGRARAQEVPGVQRAADNTLHVMDGCVNVSVADEPALKRCQAFSALQVHVCNLHCIHTHRQHAARHGRLCQRERGGRARAQEVPGVQRAAGTCM